MIGRFLFLLIATFGFSHQDASAQAFSADTKIGSTRSPGELIPRFEGVGMRMASKAASGKLLAIPINKFEAAVIGLVIITNNNDNDGQPATFTGGSGSNMAAGG